MIKDASGLLPAGITDTLAPIAAREWQAVRAIMAHCTQNGYAQVSPPLLEYEETLFAGSGEATRNRTFRMLDPEGNRMAGLRADMTAQVARIATTRMANAPRPLRLCYAGPVLSSLSRIQRKQRQRLQAGMEIFGADTASADVEVITLAVQTLNTLGITPLTLDLNLPGLSGLLLETFNIPVTAYASIGQALAMKDSAALQTLPEAELFQQLVSLAGPVKNALPALEALALPDTVLPMLTRLDTLVSGLQSAFPDLAITLDPLENRGFEYHNGISFSLLHPATQQELGRGGRFLHQQEPATGITLYVDVLTTLLPEETRQNILYAPTGTPGEMLAHWQAEGYVTMRELAPVDNPRDEARRLQCTHILEAGKAVPLTSAKH